MPTYELPQDASMIEAQNTVQQFINRLRDNRIVQQSRFLHKLLDASNGRCPDCGESIPECWEQVVARTHDGTQISPIGGYVVGSLAPAADWIGMRANCSGAETWLRLEGLV